MLERLGNTWVQIKHRPVPPEAAVDVKKTREHRSGEEGMG